MVEEELPGRVTAQEEVAEGAKFTGAKFKEAGKAAGNAPSFPDGVKNFFTRLFTN